MALRTKRPSNDISVYVKWQLLIPFQLVLQIILTENVRMLLENGAHVNPASSSGFTPLYAASMYGRNEQVVQLLIEYGASDHYKGPPPFVYVAPSARKQNLGRRLLRRE
jgi:ankyrin repeat protein